jgi:hypothetical protein
MVFAVATTKRYLLFVGFAEGERLIYQPGSCSVIIYDTEKQCPIAVIKNLHYASVTDLSW